MGAVILKDLKEHAKYRKWKQQHMDPRNASRTPSASREPLYRLRYESPLGASPSRNMDHQKPFGDDSDNSMAFERSTSYRGSIGRSIGQAPSYNGRLGALKLYSVDTKYLFIFNFLLIFICIMIFLTHKHLQKHWKHSAIHSYRSPPKPGYGLKSSTLPSNGYRNGYSSVSLKQTQHIHKNKHQHIYISIKLFFILFIQYCWSVTFLFRFVSFISLYLVPLEMFGFWCSTQFNI